LQLAEKFTFLTGLQSLPHSSERTVLVQVVQQTEPHFPLLLKQRTMAATWAIPACGNPNSYWCLEKKLVAASPPC